jgi:hypothetical protein
MARYTLIRTAGARVTSHSARSLPPHITPQKILHTPGNRQLIAVEEMKCMSTVVHYGCARLRTSAVEPWQKGNPYANQPFDTAATCSKVRYFPPQLRNFETRPHREVETPEEVY